MKMVALFKGQDQMRITKQTPLDTLLRDLEREFSAGKIGIDHNGSIKPLTNVFTDSTEYNLNIPTSRMQDRDDQTHCPYCNTVFRHSEQRSNAKDRCPFCYKIIRL